MTDTVRKPRKTSTAKAKPAAKAPAQSPDDFPCDFCKRRYRTEKKLLVHMCEPKRRHLQRDEKPVRLGFIAYQRFFARSMRNRQTPTYEAFARSSLYLAFVRFGRHLVDLNAVNPLGFVDFLLRIETPIDHWTNPVIYETYIRELNKNETPLEAIERTFAVMQQWADETGNDWRDFFRRIEEPLAALYISNGRISPWILFIAASAHDLMARFNAEQEALVARCIDVDFWRLKIERHQRDVDTIRDVLAENGV